jgi:hypothetical protein
MARNRDNGQFSTTWLPGDPSGPTRWKANVRPALAAGKPPQITDNPPTD